MILYSYWRSTTSYRVRIALRLRGLPFQTRAIDLVAGKQQSESFTELNPSQGVPALVLDDGSVLTHSKRRARKTSQTQVKDLIW